MVSNRRGFTLIELVVVVLVLGILAAVATPRYFSTSQTAVDNGLRQTLASVRDAIDLYSAQNNGSFPPCSGDGSDFRTALGPHMRGPFPSCPVGPAKNSDVVETTGASTSGEGSPTSGWKFNSTTGEFICNFSGPSVSDASIAYDTF
jgi:general secretion pathway protein G